ncbi:MAG TPA: hypothetical protein VFS05_15765 [Gemmatimonadaceae bacterium]|nr:hypothetical protein [Gemmatimonadaceae bacterium]
MPHDRHLHDDRSPSHRRASFNDPLPRGDSEEEMDDGGRGASAPDERARADAPAIPVDPQGGFGAESPAPFKRDADSGEEMTE